MFRGHRRRIRILFTVSDVVLLALAFFLAYLVRAKLNLEHDFFLRSPVVLLLAGWAMVVWVGLGYWWEIYDRIDRAHPRTILRDAFQQCLLGLASLVVFEYLLRLELSRLFVGLFAGLAWVLLCLFRLNAGRLLGVVRRGFASPHYVMVVGSNEGAVRLGRELENADEYGIRLKGFFEDSGPREIELDRTYPVFPLSELPGVLRADVIDEVIFAVDSKRLPELEETMLMCDEEGVRTRVAVDFFPHVNSHVYLDRLGPMPLLTFSATPHDEVRLLVKRVTDIFLAGAFLVLLLPVFILIAILIKLTSPGPAIFRQVRCGLNGRQFTFYKFRSMCQDAEALRASLEHLNERDLVFKIKDDPRLTVVGRWLRKFSIDEWPNFWNVLKGDMSLVGPRPALPSEVNQYKRWQRRRLRMRPGITCLWAVSGRDEVDFETWMRMDMQYIDNWSLALDWKIMLRTIPHVLIGKGAH
jgi:exopolysaccharide biosynthesis polyprenyl glycosylphosphotransferase